MHASAHAVLKLNQSSYVAYISGSIRDIVEVFRLRICGGIQEQIRFLFQPRLRAFAVADTNVMMSKF
jgi:hypothetical protein